MQNLPGPVVRVVVAEHRGSTPRGAGTVMLVNADTQIGTIGGGALEFQAVEMARRMLGTANARELVNIPLGPSLGQCCGGSVKLLLESIEAETPGGDQNPDEIYIRPVISGPIPPEPPFLVQKTLREMRSGVAKLEVKLVDGWLIEPLDVGKTPLWIYGAGHVGRALVSALDGLPFVITWVDTARERFPETLPEHVDMLVANNPAQAVKHASDDAVHLVLTYSHGLDLDICRAVLSRRFARLGLIGSDTKRARFSKRLRESGIDPARMQCPIGDRSLGKEPMAIAVGVVAELLQNRVAKDQKEGMRA